MSSGLFRGKESSNRIKLSQLVQDLLNFGVLASQQLLGRGQMIGVHLGTWGCPHTCVHACACMSMHTWTCIEIANGPPHRGIHVYHVRHACTCMHVHVCMGAPHTPTPTPTPIHSPSSPEGTSRISKNSITLQPIKIIQFCLKI